MNQFTSYDHMFYADMTFSGVSEDKLAAACRAGIEDNGYPLSGLIRCTIYTPSYGSGEHIANALSETLGENTPVMSIIPTPCTTTGEEFLISFLGDSALPVQRRYFDGETIPCAVQCGNYVYTSSLLCRGASSYEAEVTGVIDTELKALALFGLTKEHVVRHLVLSADETKYKSFNELFSPYFRQCAEPAARSLHGVRELAGGCTVAMECIAYTGSFKKAVFASDAVKSFPYCSALITEDRCYISGQVGIFDADGQPLLTLPEQSERMFQIVNAIVTACGFAPDMFVETNSYVTLSENIPSYQELFNKYFTVSPTGHHTYEVSALAHPAILVEMDAVAVRKE